MNSGGFDPKYWSGDLFYNEARDQWYTLDDGWPVDADEVFDGTEMEWLESRGALGGPEEYFDDDELFWDGDDD